MTDHTDLIHRLEAGETGREISDECLRAVGKAALIGVQNAAGQRFLFSARPNVTVSLDAALAHMVPEGWEVAMLLSRGPGRGFICVLCTTDGRPSDAKVGIAPTPAAAVCIAGLKARAQQPESAPTSPG